MNANKIQMQNQNTNPIKYFDDYDEELLQSFLFRNKNTFLFEENTNNLVNFDLSFCQLILIEMMKYNRMRIWQLSMFVKNKMLQKHPVLERSKKSKVKCYERVISKSFECHDCYIILFILNDLVHYDLVSGDQYVKNNEKHTHTR